MTTFSITQHAGPALGFVILVLLVMASVAFLGAVLERAAYRPLRQSPRLSAVVSALGASIVLQNSLMLIYGSLEFPQDILPSIPVRIFGLYIPLLRIVIFAISLGMMVGLYLFIQKTRIGTAIRAAAIDQGAARLMGINVDRVILVVFLVGPALGGAAGLLIGASVRTGQLPHGLVLRVEGLYGSRSRRHRQHTRRHLRRPVARGHRVPRLGLYFHGMEGCHRLLCVDPGIDRAPHGNSRRASGRKGMRLSRTAIFYVALTLVLVAAPFFLNAYWLDVLDSIGLYAILGLSLNIILGHAGLSNLGHAAFYAVGAYTAAILNTQYNIPILWLLPVCGLTAGLFALIVVRPIIKLRGITSAS